MINVTDGLVLL